MPGNRAHLLVVGDEHIQSIAKAIHEWGFDLVPSGPEHGIIGILRVLPRISPEQVADDSAIRAAGALQAQLTTLD